MRRLFSILILLVTFVTFAGTKVTDIPQTAPYLAPGGFDFQGFPFQIINCSQIIGLTNLPVNYFGIATSTNSAAQVSILDTNDVWLSGLNSFLAFCPSNLTATGYPFVSASGLNGGPYHLSQPYSGGQAFPAAYTNGAVAPLTAALQSLPQSGAGDWVLTNALSCLVCYPPGDAASGGLIADNGDAGSGIAPVFENGAWQIGPGVTYAPFHVDWQTNWITTNFDNVAYYPTPAPLLSSLGVNSTGTVTHLSVSFADAGIISSNAFGTNIFYGPTEMANGVQLLTNALSAWPAKPMAAGACAIVSSNGYPFMLLSTNGGTGSFSWTGTNKFGW